MHILVSNDDGIDSPGIRALTLALEALGTVHVVAPDTQQSAVGHALTIARPLRATRHLHDGRFFGMAVNGTPADCVKLAAQCLLPHRPQLVVCGINHGRNTATSLMYSGTVSGATEGTVLGLPSIAVSLDDVSDGADFTAAAEYAVKMAEWVLQHGLPAGTLLNVNVPALPPEQIKGVKVAPQGTSYWNDTYEVRTDPMGRPYYWLKGTYTLAGHDTDDHAINDGYVSVTPLRHRLTDNETLLRLQDAMK